jgi:hypothetical protein
MDFKELEQEGINWINLAHNRDCCPLVNMVMNLGGIS